MRILIVRLSAHGDIIQTLPLLNTLRQCLPEATIGWLVESSGAPLLHHHPQLNTLHTLDLKAAKVALKHGRFKEAYRLIGKTLHDIRAQEYEVALDVQGLLKSAVWPWLARIPRRVGFERSREQASRFYNDTMPYHDLYNPHKRTIDWFNEFAQAVGIHPLPAPAYVLPPLPSGVQAAVDARLGSSREQPVIVLAPGTIWASKQWPHWPQLFEQLRLHTVVLIGSPSEQEKVSAWIKQVFNGVLPPSWQNWTGQTAWPDLQALFERSTVLIGPDSAPLHLANAVGKPRLIGLFGPTAPGRTGPVGEGHICVTTQQPLDCQPCFKRRCRFEHHACMTKLSPSQVLTVLSEVLNAG